MICETCDQTLPDGAGQSIQNHPAIFAGLGMVIGLYGILYLEVARVPERGWLLAAVGFTGKILGPIGVGELIWSGEWPVSAIVLCITCDCVWWIPFGLYLYDARPWRAISAHSLRRS